MINVNKYNYNSNIFKNFNAFKVHNTVKTSASQENKEKDKSEKFSKKTKVLFALAASAAVALGIYCITRGKTPTNASSEIRPKMSYVPESESLGEIILPSAIKRPPIKHKIDFPQGYREQFNPYQLEIVDYAADEFSRSDGAYFLNDLYKGNPFKQHCYNIFYEILQAKYNNLRCANYNPAVCGNSNISQKTAVPTSLTKVNASDHWHYRLSKAFNDFQTNSNVPQEAIERFSLNVRADEKLIQSLDKYFESGKVAGYYKTPDCFQGWYTRHDPITIYLHESITPEIEQDIIKIAEPYIRSTEPVLAGKIIIPGIAKQKSPNRECIKKLVDEALSVDEKLAKAILKDFGGNAAKLEIGNAKASAGQYIVAQELIDFIKSLKVKYPSQTA